MIERTCKLTTCARPFTVRFRSEAKEFCSRACAAAFNATTCPRPKTKRKNTCGCRPKRRYSLCELA